MRARNHITKPMLPYWLHKDKEDQNLSKKILDFFDVPQLFSWDQFSTISEFVENSFVSSKDEQNALQFFLMLRRTPDWPWQIALRFGINIVENSLSRSNAKKHSRRK